jgi:receptor expression-enhancing protein 5/6
MSSNSSSNFNTNEQFSSRKDMNYSSLVQRMNEIEYRLRENKNLKILYERTKIPVVYTLAGLMSILLIIIYMFSGIRAITNIVGVVYPTYMSLKALRKEDKMDDMLWLSYWIWYGLFTTLESITDLFLSWIPLYEIMKMGFYLYLYLPNVKGGLFLYHYFLEPLIIKLERYEQEFIKNIYQIKQTISDDSITQNSSNTSASTRLRANAPTFDPDNLVETSKQFN